MARSAVEDVEQDDARHTGEKQPDSGDQDDSDWTVTELIASNLL